MNAAKKKPAPEPKKPNAEARTLSLFTGKTDMELEDGSARDGSRGLDKVRKRRPIALVWHQEKNEGYWYAAWSEAPRYKGPEDWAIIAPEGSQFRLRTAEYPTRSAAVDQGLFTSITMAAQRATELRNQ